MKIFICSFFLIISLLGCAGANNTIVTNKKVLFACKKDKKIFYKIDLKVVSSCYKLKIIRVLKENNTIKILSKLNYFKGMCAQSIKNVSIRNTIIIDKYYKNLFFTVENSKTKNLYSRKILKKCQY